MVRTGVYCWTNKVNGKVYVGSSATSLNRRMGSYLPSLRRGTCHNRHLQYAYNKYGEEAFVCSVLEYCPPEQCIDREDYWTAKLRATDPKYGYNICLKAGSRLGVGHKEESRKKMSASKKALYQVRPGPRTGSTMTAESKEKIRRTKTGKKMSKEACLKMSKSHKGLVKSEETCAKLKANHWSKGPRATEIAAKIAKGNTGKTKSVETRAKISATKRGRARPKLTLAPALPLPALSLFE